MKINKEKKKLFGYGSNYIGMMEKLFDLLLLGILWIVCCLPIITIGASTAALYYAIAKCIKNNNGYAVKEFFRSFKMNLLPGFLLEIILGAASFIVQLNIGILMAKTDGYVGLFFITFYIMLSIFLLCAACYAFPALSRFDSNIYFILKLSGYMVIKYFFTTLALLLILGCAALLFWVFPLSVLMLPGPVMFVMSDFLERILERHSPSKYTFTCH